MATPSSSRSGRPALTWASLALMLAVSLGMAYGAYTLANYAWDQVVSYDSQYLGLSGADFSGVRPDLSSPIPDATPRRVVLVIIDGLRDDVSRTMPTIEALRARGADVKLTVPQPSFTNPTWTTIVTGAPPQISGVTLNFFKGPVEVETLFDVAVGSGRTVVISSPEDAGTLFRASDVATATEIIPWSDTEYMSATVVDNALRLDAEAGGADLVFAVLGDVDVAGHAYGGDSPEYAEAAAKVDADLARLIEGLDDGNTTFVVLPDHGHIDAGGHGGWEDAATRTFAALAGPGVKQTTAEAYLEDIAPTVAVLAGMQAPLQGTGTAIDAVLTDGNGRSRDAELVRSAGITLAYIRKVLGDDGVRGIEGISDPQELRELRAQADAKRLAKERDTRLWMLLVPAGALLVLLLAVALVCRRAILPLLAAVAVEVGVYNALFFGRGFAWSLSVFNDESMIQSFFTARMIDVVIAALAGMVALVLLTRPWRDAPGERRSAAQWLALGAASVLAMQLVLAVQIGVFLWQWGATISWILPNMKAAFKFDLDLIQMTALGGAAVVAPLVLLGLAKLLGRTRAAEGTA